MRPVLGILMNSRDLHTTLDSAKWQKNGVKHADYQFNNAMSLFAKIKEQQPEFKNPRHYKSIHPSDMVESCSVAGLGFVNIVLSNKWIEKVVQKRLTCLLLNLSVEDITNHTFESSSFKFVHTFNHGRLTFVIGKQKLWRKITKKF
ncbi:amino-terminal domain arginine-tRNA ligase [Medicago truncatula]|uniref:Amino-terminal domain arginine-tRNA ligase n=1 Tax=Medicago truncatula TaxID=3880 RepID=G7KYI9_MEDTR|nr:amino-terminal domain arginine-tRNA ligase [Medicago truncatula]